MISALEAHGKRIDRLANMIEEQNGRVTDLEHWKITQDAMIKFKNELNNKTSAHNFISNTKASILIGVLGVSLAAGLVLIDSIVKTLGG